MEEQFIRDRLSQLRQAKQVSERKMSLDLGHSTSYIRSITSGRALPSMGEFLYICEYLGISPMEFFNEDSLVPLTPLQQEAINQIRTMSDTDIQALIAFIEKLNLANH
ncbi:MAG: helix-turn-helix transcriptional regulator [Lachnospiraceae bacterium]|nr:helix-turn-helix transcriptional regulator [Lachnospiraceae bacterium]